MFNEYELVSGYYGHKKSERFKLPYMKHIDDGITMLRYLGASAEAEKAWCLHPLAQSQDLNAFFKHLGETRCCPKAVFMAMEYRATANQYLSHDDFSDVSASFKLSAIEEVNQMLIVDKISNYHEMLTFELTLSEFDRIRLRSYFETWLHILDVNATLLASMRELIN